MIVLLGKAYKIIFKRKYEGEISDTLGFDFSKSWVVELMLMINPLQVIDESDFLFEQGGCLVFVESGCYPLMTKLPRA